MKSPTSTRATFSATPSKRVGMAHHLCPPASPCSARRCSLGRRKSVRDNRPRSERPRGRTSYSVPVGAAAGGPRRPSPRRFSTTSRIVSRPGWVAGLEQHLWVADRRDRRRQLRDRQCAARRGRLPPRLTVRASRKRSTLTLVAERSPAPQSNSTAYPAYRPWRPSPPKPAVHASRRSRDPHHPPPPRHRRPARLDRFQPRAR